MPFKRFCTILQQPSRTGIYSWNWELPLRHEQVLNCQKSPPPELTRQQEALAAATAAAAAAAAVTAGTTPDAIPNLPVVARMASLLGKRQRHQMGPMPPMPTMPMVQPGMMYGGTPTAAAAAAAPVSVEAASVSGGEEAGSVMAPGAAAAAAAGGGGEAGVEAAGAEERVSNRHMALCLLQVPIPRHSQLQCCNAPLLSVLGQNFSARACV
jgi:hypothetical protein